MRCAGIEAAHDYINAKRGLKVVEASQRDSSTIRKTSLCCCREKGRTARK